jgi:hypothetical protein
LASASLEIVKKGSPESDRKVLRYNRTAIIASYQTGMSLNSLHEKYGISVSHAWRLIPRSIMRNQSEALLLKKSGQMKWHKLVRMNKSRTRLISVPTSLLSKIGFDTSNDLLGRWYAEKGRLILEVKPLVELKIQNEEAILATTERKEAWNSER